MKINQYFLTVICLTSILLSCSDDKDFNKKYTRQEFVSGDIKMFTNSGEVTDETEIDKFTEGIRNSFLTNPLDQKEVYSFDDDIDVYDNYNIELMFYSENSGEVKMKSDETGEEELIKFNLKEQDDYSIISLQDTIETYFLDENERYKCVPEIISRKPLPMSMEIVTYLRPIYVKKIDDEIRIYIVSYMENKYSNNELWGQDISGATNNMISEDYLNNLKNMSEHWTDTIAYKESYIVFK